MQGNSIRSSILSIWVYFVLNILVTVTNKQIVSRTACPWLLTASHALTTFITTRAISRLQKPELTSTTTAASTSPSSSLIHHESLDTDETEHGRQNGDGTAPSLHVHLQILFPFSLIYTLNIALSNLALGLVSLNMHQTIRAMAPVITVIISITWLGRSWKEYPVGVYGAIALTIGGVMTAINAASFARISDRNGLGSRTTPFGFAITLLSAILAVMKTVLTNELQRPPHTSRWGLGLPSARLVQYVALYTVNQTVLLAIWTGEIKGLTSSLGAEPPTLILKLSGGSLRIRLPWLWLWLFNGLAASMLNLASFEANKTCGPLSMAIAANLKQVVILLLLICFRNIKMANGDEKKQAEQQAVNIIVLGSLMTAIGGIWYAFASVRMKRRQRRCSAGDDWNSEKRGWKG